MAIRHAVASSTRASSRHWGRRPALHRIMRIIRIIPGHGYAIPPSPLSPCRRPAGGVVCANVCIKWCMCIMKEARHMHAVAHTHTAHPNRHRPYHFTHPPSAPPAPPGTHPAHGRLQCRCCAAHRQPLALGRVWPPALGGMDVCICAHVCDVTMHACVHAWSVCELRSYVHVQMQACTYCTNLCIQV